MLAKERWLVRILRLAGVLTLSAFFAIIGVVILMLTSGLDFEKAAR